MVLIMISILNKINNSQSVRSALFALLLCLIFVFILEAFPPFRIADLKMMDSLLMVYRSVIINHKKDFIDDIVIIGIDNETIEKVGLKWPWPRNLYAQVISKVLEGSPKVIGIDFLFLGKSVNPANDEALREVLSGNDNIVLASFLDPKGKYLKPASIFTGDDNRRYGFTNKPVDIDSCVRRSRPYFMLLSGEIMDYPMSLKIAACFKKLEPEDIVSEIIERKQITVNMPLLVKTCDIRTIPVWKIIESDTFKNEIKDKIVFIGAVSDMARDSYISPAGYMFGVHILANETLVYVNNLWLHRLNPIMSFVLLFIFTFAAIIISSKFPLQLAFLVTFCEFIIYISTCLVLLLNSYIFPYFGGVFLLSLVFLAVNGGKYINLMVENLVLKEEIDIDGLTKLYVFRYFEDKLKLELANVSLTQDKLALVIYDIDHFKKVNDTYGHDFGNEVLKSVADVLKKNSREYDIVCRYGGEEFCTLLKYSGGGTGDTSPFVYAERVLAAVKSLNFKVRGSGDSVRITISAGVVTTDDDIEKDYASFFRAADSALYEAKNAGRDRVCEYGSLES